jgi:hypothetical protein
MKILIRSLYAVVATLSVVMSLQGCHLRRVTKQRLVRMIDQDKDLSQTREVGGIKVQMKYVPYSLMVLQELEASGSADTDRVRVLEKKYSPQYYFRLTFSKNNQEVIRQLGSFHQYSNMLQVLSFELGSHINALTGKGDTVYLKDYAFEQDFGMSSANASLLVFARKDFDKSREISLNIGEFGLGIGEIRFVFDKKEMEELPLPDYTKTD